MESEPEVSRDALGGRDRQADAGADGGARSGQAQSVLRQGAADRPGKNTRYISGQPQRAFGFVAEREKRDASRTVAPDLLECGAPVGGRWFSQPAMSPLLQARFSVDYPNKPAV